MEEKSKKKKGVTKRDIIELSIVVVVFLVIYLTGSQAEVFGKVQQAVLVTGVANATALDADEVVDADYNFRLVNEEGNKIDVRDLKGKTLFINIWATWCPPCVAEMPNINSLYNKIENKDDIVFLMISHDDEMRTAQSWVKRKGFDFPVFKLASPLPDVFETEVVPSTFVVSPEGKIVVSKTGMANYDTKRFKKYLLKLAEK